MDIPSDDKELVECIEKSLTKTGTRKSELKTQLESVRQELAHVTASEKSKLKMLRDLRGKSGGITKQQLKPLIEKILRLRGPLDEKQLCEEIKRVLAKNEMPLSGLALIVRVLKSSYAGTDDMWRLEPENGPAE